MYLQTKRLRQYQNQNKNKVKKYSIFIILSFLFLDILAQRPKDLYLMGVAKIISDQPDSALQYLSAAITREPDNYQYYLRRGEVSFKTGEFKAAIKDFEAVNYMESELSDLWIAKCYASLNNDSLAIFYLKKHLQSAYRMPEKSIKTDKAFNQLQLTDGWFQLWQEEWYTPEEKLEDDINYLVKNDKYLDALQLIDEKIPASENPKPLYRYRAQIESQQGNFKASAMDWTRVINEDRDNLNAYKSRGVAYLKAEKFKEALDDFSKTLRLDPADFESYILRAKASRKLKDYSSAVKDVLSYLQFFPNDEKSLLLCGELYYDNGNYMEALRIFNKNLKMDSSNPEYFKARGKTYYQTKMYKYAIDDLSMSLDLKPDDGEVYLFKGLARYYSGDRAGACADWKIGASYGETRAVEQILKYCQ